MIKASWISQLEQLNKLSVEIGQNHIGIVYMHCKRLKSSRFPVHDLQNKLAKNHNVTEKNPVCAAQEHANPNTESITKCNSGFIENWNLEFIYDLSSLFAKVEGTIWSMIYQAVVWQGNHVHQTNTIKYCSTANNLNGMQAFMHISIYKDLNGNFNIY